MHVFRNFIDEALVLSMKYFHLDEKEQIVA